MIVLEKIIMINIEVHIMDIKLLDKFKNLMFNINYIYNSFIIVK